VYHGYESSLPAAGEYEGLVIAQSMRGHDGQEGIAAFAEKRSPEFTGE
jgi:2-(1,2-epoxy-1,2-dihydrophenyl)acetyl-CoA isomerase